MFCEKCGKEIAENANFCRYCGNPVRKSIQDLVERARHNDQSALAEIYRYSSSSVYRVIKVLVKDEDTVSDLLQDTYVKAFTRLDQLQNPERLVPWLKMIANNTAKDWLKKSKPVFFSEMSVNEDFSDEISFEESIEDEHTEINPEMAADEKEVRRLVMEILDQLPEDQRMVIGMFYYEEMTVKDIAEALEVSENTVKSRLLYGRKKIKEQVLELEKQGTKLYTVAPFVFFLYLLRRMQSAPAGVSELETLQHVMESGICKTSVPGGAVGQIEAETENISGVQKSSGKTAGVSGHTAKGTAAKAVTGTVTKTAAKHVGIKVASLLLVGTIGAGGIAYGVMKNTDRLPFGTGSMKVVQNGLKDTAQEKDTKEASDKSDKKTDAQDKKVVKVSPEAEEVQEDSGQENSVQESAAQADRQSQNVEANADAATLYGTFYEKYIADENLLVIGDGTVSEYDYNTGYTQDMLLGAYMDDFGGDGAQELLLVRTVGTPSDEQADGYPDTNRSLQMEFYNADGGQVNLLQSVDIPDSNLNSSAAYVKEQIAVQKKDNACYLYRYGMYHASAGSGVFDDTFFRITDKEIVQENHMDYLFDAVSGWCKINGTDTYTGDKDSTISNLNGVLSQYGVQAFDELNMPLITGVNREEKYDSGMHWSVTFQIQNCFAASGGNVESMENAEAETGYTRMETGYYGTVLNPNSTAPDLTRAVEYDDNSITFYGTFQKSDTIPMENSVMLEDGVRTFEITPQTEYYGNEQEDYYPWSKESALQACKNLNGLVVVLKVTAGKIDTMTFFS